MKNYTPKVGDLVCYNAAGMRKHSLGLVVERRIEVLDSRKPFDKAPFVFIQWIEKPTKPPRSDYCYSWKDATDSIALSRTPDGCTAAWYRDIGCFEVIEKK